jgi:hypothetical protein
VCAVCAFGGCGGVYAFRGCGAVCAVEAFGGDGGLAFGGRGAVRIRHETLKDNNIVLGYEKDIKRQ